MRRIEKTKENIGVSGLDPRTRKKLFNDFIDAGGKVINEKNERQLFQSDRELQKKYRQQLQQVRKQNKLFREKDQTESKKTLKTPPGVKSKNPSSKEIEDIKNISPSRLFFQRFKIRTILLFTKVTDFSGYYFTTKFLRNLDDEYMPSLLSIQDTFSRLFKQDMHTGKKITELLDNMHPIYYESIELLSNIYDRSIANEILEHYYNFPDISQDFTEIREPFTKIFRKLHPLKPYKEIILTGLEKAYHAKTYIEKKKFSYFSSGRRKAKNDIYIIFNKLYPRLYWLMCSYEGKILISENDIKNAVALSADDIPGKRKRNILKTLEELLGENVPEENEAEEQHEKAEKEQETAVPDVVKRGLELMQKVDRARHSENYLKNSVFRTLNKNDKIFITNLFFDEFEREYSLILTTNKIKYYTVSRSSENLDRKGKFATIYNEIGKCKNRLRDYFNTIAAYEKLKGEKPISSTQYIEYSNRLSALDKEKKQTGADTRIYIKAFLEKLCKELKLLIDDMNKNCNMVINPDDIIVFETEIEGEKKLNGKSVREAITCAYDYSSAFIYRLNEGGDLSGDLEFAEGQMDTPDQANPEENTPPGEKNDKPSGKNGSILNELDDFI